MENVISEEIANKEIQKWLDFKNVSPRKRNTKETKAQIETLVDAICDGDLVLDEDFNLVQALRNPVLDKDGKPALKEMVFKPRLLLEDVESKLMNVKSDNTIGMLAAYTSALTGVNSAMTKKIDTDDNKTAQAIVMFFL
jgi:hypothetical protein